MCMVYACKHIQWEFYSYLIWTIWRILWTWTRASILKTTTKNEKMILTIRKQTVSFFHVLMVFCCFYFAFACVFSSAFLFSFPLLIFHFFFFVSNAKRAQMKKSTAFEAFLAKHNILVACLLTTLENNVRNRIGNIWNNLREKVHLFLSLCLLLSLTNILFLQTEKIKKSSRGRQKGLT